MKVAPKQISQGQVRLGSITRYNRKKGMCDISLRTDLWHPDRVNIPVTMPYLGRGWGIMAGIEERSNVLIGEQYGTGPVVLGYTPVEGYLQTSIADVLDADRSYESTYRMPLVGEIMLQSKADSYVYLDKWGSIKLVIDPATYVKVDKQNSAYMRRIDQVYCKSDSMLSVSGKIKRDLNPRIERDKGPGSRLSYRHLCDPRHHLYEQSLAIIADRPEIDYFPYTIPEPEESSATGLPSQPPAQYRNPALAETRMRFYEYADDEMNYLIRPDEDDNHDWVSVDEYLNVNYKADRVFRSRAQASTEIVKNEANLSELMPKRQSCLGQNVLGEMILGTVVESDGEIFDIEGNNISSKHGLFKDNEEFNAETCHNKGRVFHFELNSKQFEVPEGAVDFEPVNTTISGNNEFHKRFNFDIDKEGRTSVRIPSATHIKGYSRTGAFHIEHSYEDITYGHKDTGKKDYKGRAAYFGGEGTSPKGISLNLKLDGSLEADFGKDAYDAKSIALNTSGMVVAWLGSDAPLDDDKTSEIHSGKRYNRSLVLQTDGSVEGIIGREKTNKRSADLELKGGLNLKINDVEKEERADPGVSIDATGQWTQKVSGGMCLNVDGNFCATALNSYTVRVPQNDGRYSVMASNNIFMKSAQNYQIVAGQAITIMGGMGSGGQILMQANEIVMMATNIKFIATQTILSGSGGAHTVRGSPLLLIPV